MGKRKRRQRDPGGPSLEALAGAVIAGTIGYLAAEASIPQAAMHPLHWLVTGVAVVIGYWAGQGVYWWKQR